MLKSAFVGVIIVWGFIIGLTVGWGINIYKLTSLDFEEPYKAEVLRIIGLPVAPMGGVIGYMDIGEE